MIFYEPRHRDRKLFPHDPFKAMIVPRPIGWISTMSRTDHVNLAPYSYFNAFCSWPQIVGFSSEGERTVVFGQVVGVHIDERYLKNGRLDAAGMQAIARCGYDEYTVIDRVFSIERPTGAGNAFGGPGG